VTRGRDGDAAALPVLEALIVATLVVGAIFFVALLRRGAEVPSAAGAAKEDRAAGDAMAALQDLALVVPDCVGPPAGPCTKDFATWVGDLATSSADAAAVDAVVRPLLVQLLPPGYAFDLRLDYGMGSLPLLAPGFASPVVAHGASAFLPMPNVGPGQAAGTPGPQDCTLIGLLPVAETVQRVAPGADASPPAGTLPPTILSCRRFGASAMTGNPLATTPAITCIVDPLGNLRAPFGDGRAWLEVWQHPDGPAVPHTAATVPDGIPFGRWAGYASPATCPPATPPDATADVVLPDGSLPAATPLYSVELVVGPRA
jgi:hypothetical protein